MADKKPTVADKIAMLWRVSERKKAIDLAVESKIPTDKWPEGMFAYALEANIRL